MERLATLLDLRHRLIVPHLAEAGGHCGTCLEAADGRLAIDWTLGTRRLSLRARFGEATLPDGPGEVIHRTEGPRAEAVHSIGAA
jgi:hypothetical protein